MSTEVNHFLCSMLFVEESCNIFSCWGMPCLLLSLLLGEAGQPGVCFWGIWASLITFIHHLKALDLLLIYLEGLENYPSVLSQSFFVVASCYYQSFSFEFNESLTDELMLCTWMLHVERLHQLKGTWFLGLNIMLLAFCFGFDCFSDHCCNTSALDFVVQSSYGNTSSEAGVGMK